MAFYTGRDGDPFRPVDGGDLDDGPQKRVSHLDLPGHVQVVARSFEDGMFRHLHGYIEVTTLPRTPLVALALQPQLFPARDPFRYLDVHLFRTRRRGQRDPFFRPMYGVHEGYLQFVVEVEVLCCLRALLLPRDVIVEVPRLLPPLLLCPPACLPAEDHAEDVSPAEAEVLEEVSHVETPEDVFFAVALLEAPHAEGIELLAFFRVAQHRVGLVDELELFFRLLVSRVAVGMVLQGQFPVRLLYLVFGSRFGDAEQFVVILLSCHTVRHLT